MLILLVLHETRSIYNTSTFLQLDEETRRQKKRGPSLYQVFLLEHYERGTLSTAFQQLLFAWMYSGYVTKLQRHLG